MPYLRLRLYKPEKLLSAQSAPLHLELTSAGYFIDDFSFRDGEHYESPGKAVVTFSQATKMLEGKLSYESRWTDPGDNRTYHANVRFSLPLEEPIESFIASHDFGAQYLILTVYLEDKDHAVLTMGDDEDQECIWTTAIASSLHAKIQWLSVDLDPRPEIEPMVVELPRPLQWQADAIASFNQMQMQQLQAIQELKRQVVAIKVVLFALVIAALICGFAK